MVGTGLRECRDTPGNLGAHLAGWDLADVQTAVLTINWWTDLDAIRAFVGDDLEAARFYPEDDRYLVNRERRVQHFVVLTGSALPPTTP